MTDTWHKVFPLYLHLQSTHTKKDLGLSLDASWPVQTFRENWKSQRPLARKKRTVLKARH